MAAEEVVVRGKEAEKDGEGDGVSSDALGGGVVARINCCDEEEEAEEEEDADVNDDCDDEDIDDDEVTVEEDTIEEEDDDEETDAIEDEGATTTTALVGDTLVREDDDEFINDGDAVEPGLPPATEVFNKIAERRMFVASAQLSTGFFTYRPIPPPLVTLTLLSNKHLLSR
jgi:hypothetical protein